MDRKKIFADASVSIKVGLKCFIDKVRLCRVIYSIVSDITRIFNSENRAFLKRYLREGAHIWKESRFLPLLIHELLARRESELVLHILKYVDDPDIPLENKGRKFTVLHMAAWNNMQDVALYVLRRGADINKQMSVFLETALHLDVVGSNNLDLCKILVQRGADIEAKDIEGYTPILAAVKYQRLDVVEFLYKNGANLSAVTEDGRTAIHILLQTSRLFVNLKLLKFILKSNCDPNQACYEEALTPLHILAFNDSLTNRIETAKVLIKYGASLNPLLYNSDTLLHITAISTRNDVEFIKFLIDMGVETSKLSAGRTFLDYFTRGNRHIMIEVVLYLLLKERLNLIPLSAELEDTMGYALSEIKVNCREELQILGDKIKSLKYSYLELSHFEENILVTLCRNQDIRRAIEEFDYTDFPIYGEFIGYKFREALKLHKTKDEYTKNLLILAGNRISYYTVEDIVKLLHVSK